MTKYTKEQLDKIWEKGLKVDKYNPDFVRKDACGAWIIRELYNDRTSSFGWEVDHIYPESKLQSMEVPQDKIDNLINLRPLNWRNNDSKGADYPHYQSKLKAGSIKDEKGQDHDLNVRGEDEKEINYDIQQQIIELFKGYSL